MLLCSCSTVDTAPYELGSNRNAVLRGTPTYRQCTPPTVYDQPIPSLDLAEPVSFGSIHNATEVELILPEQYQIEFGRFLDHTIKVRCELVESALCGYVRLACAVVKLTVEP